MIPIVFLFFFLAQAQADEFPSLMKHVDVTWGNQLLTSQLNPRQTMSIDGAVPSFILCGAFKISGKDGKCHAALTIAIPIILHTSSTYLGNSK